MKKIILILTLLFIVGCSGNLGEDDLSASWYKGVTDAEIPGVCLDSQDDVCTLFDCMVDLCWCDDSGPDLPILYEGESIEILTEEEAVSYVQKFVGEEFTVTRVVKLNDIFFNIFAEDGSGEETTYTLAVDGTIMTTICGI